MKKILIILSIVITIVIIALWAWQSSQGVPTAKIENQSFNLYVAKTAKDKEIGLSKYKNLEDNRGMVFTFDKPAYYSFWMKKMKFPIDIIFIKDDKIITIHKNVHPPKENQELTVYSPEQPADTVLEVNAGISQKHKLEQGDTITLSNI